jgi:ubiquitin carboxyl-terminal hydrolase 7
MTAGGGPRDEAVPDIIVSTDGAPQPAVATVANNTPEGDEMDVDKAEATEDDGSLTGQFTWIIENFNKLKQPKLYSPVFQSGQYNWRILLFPSGNNVTQLSVYLDVADSATLPQGWSRQAHFTLTVHNQKDPSRSVIKDADHHFTIRACDWGFREFVPLSELRDPRSGFCVDEKVMISAKVKVEPQVNWWNWDSKKETGYVGLKNQGATCYMNSLLQTLTHIPYFRKAVYHMHTTDGEDPENSIPLSLQRIFYKLQYSDASVSTKQLTKSFGWDTYDTFMQHDVQELNRVLVDKLEEKMKATSVEGTMAHLFRGKFTNYVRCVNVDDVSTRDEDFYDLQMPVKGCKDLYASLDEYVKEETLDGDNQYQSERYGKQDAKKGVAFKSLPPVLELHLRLFEYDFTTDAMAKINERFEFPTTLDMDREDRKYFTADSDPNVVNVYRLHSVLVHSGGPNGGHYYAFIRPLTSDQWYKFDDERVTKVKEKEAVEGQFGGSEHQTHPGHTPQWKFPKISNAYMLVYVRESAIPEINVEVTADDVAAHLRLTLEKEQEEKARKKKERLEAHLYTVVRLATHKELSAEIGADRFFDLVTHEKAQTLRIKKELTLLHLKQEIWRLTGARPSQQRLWLWAKRQNHTFRPDRPLQLEYDDHVPMMDVKEDHTPQTGKFQAELRLYLEVIGDVQPIPGPDAVAPEDEGWPQLLPGQLLLFFKFYEPEHERLSFVGSHVAMQHHTLTDLLPVLRGARGLPPTQELAVYEEVEFETSVRFEVLSESKTLKESELQSGDIIVYQTLPLPDIVAPAAGAEVDGEDHEPLLKIPAFFERVKNRVVVNVHKLPPQQHHGQGVREKERAMQITLDKRMTYDQVTAKLGKALSCDPLCLRLTMHNPFSDLPKPQPIKYRGVESLQEMLTSFQKTSDALFYEVLSIPLPEYEAKKSLKVSWHNRAAEEVKVVHLLLNKEGTVADALAALSKEIPKEDGAGDAMEVAEPSAQPRRLRMMEVFNHRIYKIFQEHEEIDNINDQYWTIRAEELAPEEAAMGPDDKLVHVRHFYRETRMNMTHNFGDPFLVMIGAEETLASVRGRIQTKLCVPDEEIAKWKLAVVSFGRVEYLEDEDVVRSRFRKHDNYGNWDDYLGLEHPQVPGTGRKKHTARTHHDKPVKIYG